MSAHSWFARHGQTLVGSLGRLLQQPLATGMTVGVIAVALALPLLLSVLLENTRSATANWNQAFQISVYMDKKAPGSRVQALANQLRTRPDVAAVQVIGADEALAQFRLASGFGSALGALTDNPLPDTLVVAPAIAASTPEGILALKVAIAAVPGVQAVQLDTEWVKRLQTLMDIVDRVVWLSAAIMGLGVVLVIGNTIRLDILNRRAEIEVMKLVGATDGFTRRPFLYSGFWYGLGGGLSALALEMVAVGLIAGPVRRLALLYGSQFHLRGIGFGPAAVVLSLAVAFGWVGSWLAASRHIRGIEPT